VSSAAEFPVLLFTEDRSKSSAEDRSGKSSDPGSLEAAGVEVIEIRSRQGRLDMEAILNELGMRQITSVLVEGGSEIAAAFLDRDLVDKVTFFYGPKIIGGKDAIPAVGGDGAFDAGFSDLFGSGSGRETWRRLGGDWLSCK
jgi:riboflavin biosynthesis pyrimidine reductase